MSFPRPVRALMALLPAALPAALPATAETAMTDTAPVALVTVPVRVENLSDAPVLCAVQLAHWFADEMGRIAPGETLETALHADPADGTVYRLNAAGDRMPVEGLWCGIAGRAWETRAPLPLDRRAGTEPAPIAVTCAVAADRLACG